MDMSAARKNRIGLEGPQSRLFHEAIRIMKEIKSVQPAGTKLYFIMENVASMSKADRNKISSELAEVFPELKLLKINSSVIAPAHRRRYYWTNIPNIKPLTPNGKKFRDVLVNGYPDKDMEKANVILSSNVTLTNGIKRIYNMQMGNIIFKDENFAQLPPEVKLEKYPTILKESGYVGRAKRGMDEYAYENGCYRLPSVLELERMMTFPDGFVSGVPGVSRTEKQKALGLSFTVDVVAHLLCSFELKS